MRIIQREIVAGLIRAKDGKFLFGKKNPRAGGVYADCWHTPGGGVDKGESLLAALKREMFEEVGLDIASFRVTLLDDKESATAEKILKETGEKVQVAMHFHVYEIRIENQTSAEVRVKPGDDLIELGWFGEEEFSRIKLTPPSVKLFEKLGFLGVKHSSER